jgi:hypothetical protein
VKRVPPFGVWSRRELCSSVTREIRDTIEIDASPDQCGASQIRLIFGIADS